MAPSTAATNSAVVFSDQLVCQRVELQLFSLSTGENKTPQTAHIKKSASQKSSK